MSWHKERWTPVLAWTTPSGKLLRQAVKVLAERVKTPSLELIIFGSSPLQMGVSSAVSSGDLDVATDEDVEKFLKSAQLTKFQRSPYVEVCSLNTFRTAPDWRTRAHSENLFGFFLIFPHPIDILVSKVKRCEEKDIEAFLEVIKVTGHPTENELKESLQRAVDIYLPGFDESTAHDPVHNTGILRMLLYGKEINVREEIIIPGNSHRTAHNP